MENLINISLESDVIPDLWPSRDLHPCVVDAVLLEQRWEEEDLVEHGHAEFPVRGFLLKYNETLEHLGSQA